MKKVYIEGVNADVDAGTEDVIPDGASRTFPAAAAETTVVSSDTNDDGSPVGTGARTVRIYGLNAGLEEIYEDATLNGTSAVTLVKQFFRVNGIEVLTAGSGFANAGTIDVKHSSTVLARMEIGANYARNGQYTPGKNRSAWAVKKFSAGITNAAANTVTFDLMTRKQSGVWLLRRSIALHGTGRPSAELTLETPIFLDAGEDIRIRATSSGANSAVIAGIDLVGAEFLP